MSMMPKTTSPERVDAAQRTETAEEGRRTTIAEARRLEEARDRRVHWKRWGPYLSERAWGTVREDYSEGGTAWDDLPHDAARSRAYRWNEDGLAGVSDRHQLLCFAVALWNGKDPILKERLYGLTGSEGNHGEDVKELYHYLDSTPTHSYMRYLYKYPQAPFPYRDLVETNARRSRAEPEYELIDTGIFAEDRYFDVTVEYAKSSPEEILVAITVDNRGPEAAPIELLPTLWFRNRWSRRPTPRPSLRAQGAAIHATHYRLGARFRSFSPRTRPTASGSGGVRTRPPTSRTVSITMWSAARPVPSTPRGWGPAPRPTTAWSSPAAGAPPFACASVWPRPAASAPTSTRSSRPASPRPTTTTRPSCRLGSRPSSAGSFARPWPACCGASSTTPSTSRAGSRSRAAIR
jgi:hypothetical protein